MTPTMSRKIGVPKQRGIWLRYFLGAILCWAGGASLLNAQLDVPGPERLTHVQGLIVNDAGHPMPNLPVTLLRDDKIAYETKTDVSGQFRFDHVSGRYTFKVARSQYAAASREIAVTDEVVTALERKKLYVILGPSQCEDACSWVLASKREFDRELRHTTKH